MENVNRVLAAILVLSFCYLAYGSYQLKKELFRIFETPDQYVYLPENAQTDLIVVDFNKFGCDLCQALHPVLLQAVKQDGHVRYVPKTLTNGLIWEETLLAAVYAAGEQGKFIEMHDMIYRRWPVNDHKTLFLYAKGLGLDTEKLSRDMSKTEIRDHVHEDQEFFNAWRFDRVPTLLMGKEVIYIPGAKTPTVEELLEKFAKARAQ